MYQILSYQFNLSDKVRLLICCTALISTISYSQPLWESKKMIEDFIVFSDLHNPNLKYYAPGNLKLKTKLTGEPDFILTQLRYTGVSLYGNQGEKRFTNIIQMNIEMERMDPINLEKLRNQFHFSPQIKWVPLAIQNLESTLIYSASSLESKDDQNLKKTNGFFVTVSLKHSRHFHHNCHATGVIISTCKIYRNRSSQRIYGTAKQLQT